MHNVLFKRFGILLIVSLSIFSLQCKKEQQGDDPFCTLQRNTFQSFNNKEGTVVYSSKFSRYGVSFTVTAPNNIDSQLIGYTCDLPKELQKVGLQVMVSGTIKTFNQSENMKPEIAGQDLYYLETNYIIKK